MVELGAADLFGPQRAADDHRVGAGAHHRHVE